MFRFHLGEVLSTGTVFGVLYFATNLVLFFPSEQLFLMQSVPLRMNLFLYSFCVWLVAFVLLSALSFIITMPLVAAGSGRVFAFVRRWIVYSILFFVFMAGFCVWFAYSDSPASLPGHLKIAAMKEAALIALGVAGVIALVASAIVTLTGRGDRRMRRRHVGVLAAIAALSFIYVGSVGLASFRRSPVSNESGTNDVHARNVLVVADGGSWNVLQPLVENGDLPGFKRLIDTGTAGYLSTHGPQFTPPSWTTIATGKSQALHGISGFTNLSSEWQAAPIWSIMSRAGKTVGVANWICTWPPFAVSGAFVSNVITYHTDLAFLAPEFEAYRDAADEITRPWERANPDADTSIVAYSKEELRRVAAIDDRIVSNIGPDFVAYGYYSTDKMQHFYWKDMEPGAFDGGDWAGEEINRENADAIRRTWIGVDGFISDLMDRYGDEANYFVVSDHGSRRIDRRSVDFDVAGLLEQMGYLVRDGDNIDYARSSCSPSRWNMQPHIYDLDIRPDTSNAEWNPDPARYDKLRDEVVRTLRQVRVGGTPIFSRVDTLDGLSADHAPDIRAVAGELLMTMPDEGTALHVGSKEILLRRLMTFGSWSGRHRARGIFLAKGPAIRHGYTGAWTIDDPYTSIVRYGYGVFGLADRVCGPLRSLHLVDDATTLDIAPTILYLSGLPIARDMQGSVLEGVVAPDFLDDNAITSVPTYEKGVVLEGGLSDDDREKILKRMKDLGYL